MSSSSPLEQASTDLKVAKLVVNQLDQVFENLQSHAFSVLSLSDQWRNCQSSFAMIEASLASRVKELETKEREIGNFAVSVENRKEEVELRQKRVESAEKSVFETIKTVEMREKQVREDFEVLELEKRRISEHCKALESKEKSCRALEEREKQLNERCRTMEEREKQLNERCRGMEEREKQLNERCGEVELAEKFSNKRCMQMELREKEMSEHREALELREKGLKERLQELESKEKDMNRGFEARCRGLELKEKQMDEVFEALELKEREIRASCKGLEMKEKEVDERCQAVELREKQMNEGAGAIELKAKQVDECCKGVVMKCNEAVTLREKQINECLRSLGLIMKQISERCKGVELKEKEVKERCKAVDLKEKRIDDGLQTLELKVKEIAERCKEVELKEKEIDERCQAMDVNEKQINRCRAALNSREKRINERSRDLELKEKEFNEGWHALELKEKQIDESIRSLELKEEQINELLKGQELKVKQINLREKRISERCRDLELKEKEFNEGWHALELKEKQIDESLRNLELKEKQINELLKEQELKVKQISDSYNELELKEKQINEGCKVLELKEKQIDERCSALELKEKQLSDTVNLPIKTTSDSNYEVGNNEDDTQIRNLCVAMSGKALQIFLNERVNKHHSMGEKVGNALKLLTEPTKLVLAALNGFFPSNLKSTDVVYEASAVRSSCVLLLEQLMIMKPVVSEAVRKDAVKVASEWREKMRTEGEDDIVVLGFLLLLVAYKLVSYFERDELQRLYEMVDQHRMAPLLHLRLGLTKTENGNSSAQRKTEQHQLETLRGTSGVDSSLIGVPSDIQVLCRNMDVNGVKHYLIDHVKQCEILQLEKISDSLQLASDPAKLVLDVTRTFYQLKMDNGPCDDCKASCIFLLIQLMNLRADVTPHVKDEARKFAAAWRGSLAKRGIIPLEVFGFLQFLASYKLARLYEADELLSLFGTLYNESEVYWPEQIPCLCHALGLTKKIPGLVRSLIKRDKQLQAVRYICALKMEDAFPPVPLLKSHLEIISKRVEEMAMEGSDTAQDDAASMELSALREVLECIFDFKLEFTYSPAPLESRINQLEKEMKERKTTKSVKEKPVELSIKQFKGTKRCQNIEKEKREGHNYAQVENKVQEKSTISPAPPSDPQSDSREDTKKRSNLPIVSPRQEKHPRLGSGQSLHRRDPTCEDPELYWRYANPVQLHGAFTYLPSTYRSSHHFRASDDDYTYGDQYHKADPTGAPYNRLSR